MSGINDPEPRSATAATTTLDPVIPTPSFRFRKSADVVVCSPMAASGNQGISTRATGVVGIAILRSRVLGLIRDQVFAGLFGAGKNLRSEEHTSELQSHSDLVCRLLLEKKKKQKTRTSST